MRHAMRSPSPAFRYIATHQAMPSMKSAVNRSPTEASRLVMGSVAPGAHAPILTYLAVTAGFNRAASFSRPALAANADASMPRSFFAVRSAPAASKASTASSLP